MEKLRTVLFIATLFLGMVLWTKWVEFSKPQQSNTSTVQGETNEIPVANQTAVSNSDEVPNAPLSSPLAAPETQTNQSEVSNIPLIQVETDLVNARINPQGGVLEGLDLMRQPIALDQPNIGFPLLKKSGSDIAVLQDGLVTTGQPAPNHVDTRYTTQQNNYSLGNSEELRVPLKWVSDSGIEFVKTFVFKRDSYLVEIEYQINNRSNQPWNGAIYGQFQNSEITKKGGGFGQLPSYAGAVFHTQDEKYEKVSFKDMRSENYQSNSSAGWVAMIQHYFVTAWTPNQEVNKQFYTSASQNKVPATFRAGYRDEVLTQVAPGETVTMKTAAYLGPKTQKRLKSLEDNNNIEDLSLTVDYGMLTFIADPLFIALSWIYDLVGNWGWAIIILTILIKAVFYPLSAKSYKSMAGMKKLQPRIQTLKERYKDDRQKFQMEMMALYKKEKINPAGGCLPILVQIPVFIALYWVLLESVEMRHAPFALWLQDLSSKDPYFILPILMGVSMWAQQKLNPAPTDDIQKKVMMIMPIALTFLFLSFPQGLVLYWVVNNVLGIAQQWLINKRHAA